MSFTPPTLMPHQIPMKNFIVQQPFCGIWLDVGGAKTLTTLAALAEIRPSGHILVVAPLAIARSSWTDEIQKWGFPMRTKSLVVDENDKKLSRAQRLKIYDEIFTSFPTMYFINQDLLDDLVKAMPTKKYGRKSQTIWPFPTVILDEAQEFKNPSSVRFKALKSVRPAILRLIELTGTPSPQSLLDIWSQIYLLDEGLALGDRFTAFRETYFQPEKFVNGRPVRWKPFPWTEAVIHERIKHLVLSTENTSLPMPPISYEQVPVALPPDAQSAYREFKRDQVLELATPDPKNPARLIITADNAAILRGKLLQFASGTLYTGDDHDNEFAVMHTAKLRKLAEIARDARMRNEPLLVAYRYRSDAQLIPQALRDAGFHVEVFDGSREMRHRWNRREIPIMLLQPASYGRGLNMQQGSSELVWYTLPDSLEQWIQTIGRLHRIGQPHPVRVRSLIALDTIDARQPDLLKRKKITQDALVEAVRYEIADDLQALQLV